MTNIIIKLPRALHALQTDIFGQTPKVRHSMRIGDFGYMMHFTGQRGAQWVAPKYVSFNEIVWC